ncbi:hypothetical protein DNTS_013330 [Danionella cerebrum]|nr:hypothetical protein DNTS_013330 [Danionella translucida]TRY88957.1 hypothetical protein DNTS_013330 [Danionella translucida]TRY88958.1 hypothetical protein DNTS_013330 [Danionella translucida]
MREKMPCLNAESLSSLPDQRGSRGEKKAKGGEKGAILERKEQKVIASAGWLRSPLRAPVVKTQRLGFRMGKESEKVRTWLDDCSDSARSYFSRSSRSLMNGCVEKAQAAQNLITDPRSRRTSLDLRRKSHPMCGLSQTSMESSTTERPHSCLPVFHRIDSLDQDKSHCPQTLDVPISLSVSRWKCSNCLSSPRCTGDDACNFMMKLFGDLFGPTQEENIYFQVLQHLCEVTHAQRCLISMTTMDRAGEKCLGPVFQSDGESVYNNQQTEWVKCIMGYVVSTGRPLILRDVHESSTIQSELYGREEYIPKGVLSLPVLNHKNEVIGVVMAVNKTRTGSREVVSFSQQDEKVLSSHMTFLGLILENSQLFRSSEQEGKRNQTTPEGTDRFVVSQKPFSRMVRTEHNKSNFSVHSATRKCDIYDLSYIHALHVQNSMETLNIVNHMAQTSKISEIRSLISTPLRDRQEDNLLGVCHLVNKTSALNETQAFSRAEEHLLEDFAVFCALGLQKFNSQQTVDETRARLAVTTEVLSYQISASQEKPEDLEEPAIPSSDTLCLRDFGFSDFSLSQAAMTQAVVRMFLDLNLPQEFSIDYKALCQWVLSVQKCYRSNVVYHNWSHALRTAQCMFAMMQTDEFKNNFSSMEVLALMIASLCHDLDHRGVNNSYVVRSNQPLSQLYGQSSLEHHHYDMCLLILNNPGSQILSSLSVNKYKACVQMIEKNILATDLAIYIE